MERLLKDLFSGKNVVVITGAGISTASGIPDFRSDNGLYKKPNEELYEKYPYLEEEVQKYGGPAYLMSRIFLKKHPDAFYDFYTSNKILSDDVKPNICHEVLAELEEAGYIQAVITQNIDNLHQGAGSKNVIPIHGTNKFYCECCGKEYSKQHYMTEGYACTHVDEKGNKCEGIIRPGIVLYGEGYNIDDYRKCMEAAVYADVMIVAGSSITVSTIMKFINLFLGGYNSNKPLYILNNQPTQYDCWGQRYEIDLPIIFKKIGEMLEEERRSTNVLIKK